MARTTELARAKDDGLIAGVCAGIGNYFGINPWLARILFLFVPGPNIIVYAVLWLLMPEQAASEPPPAPEWPDAA